MKPAVWQVNASDLFYDLRAWIFCALALSLLTGTLDVPSSELIVVALMVQMTLSMDGLSISKEALSEGRREMLHSVVLCYVVNTGVTLAVGAAFMLSGYETMWRGWVLLASMPCAISVVTAAILTRGDLNAAVIAVTSTYVSGIVLAPLISFVLIGNAVDPLEILKYIVLFIVIPAALTIPLKRLRLGRSLKVPVINLMMALMLFLSVNSNREYMLTYPEMILIVLVAAGARLLALSLISSWMNRRLNTDRRSVPVLHVLCIWKNTGLSVSMCMLLLSGAPESVIPCFTCMIVESLWFSMYTERESKRQAVARRNASASPSIC